MKYFILVLAVIVAVAYVRIQANDLAKAMYTEGCTDAALKLQKTNHLEQSNLIYAFCAARKDTLDKFMKPFED